MLRRLVIVLLLVLLLAAALVAVAQIVLVPVAEGRAEEELGRVFDAEVDVVLDPPFVPSLLGGRVGDVDVRIERLRRGGLELEDVRGVLRDARLSPRELTRDDPQVRFDGVSLEASASAAALEAYLRPRLVRAGVAGAATLTVAIGARQAVARLGGGVVPLTVRRVGPSSILVQPLGRGPGAAEARRALRGPIELGALPYGLALTGVRLAPGRIVAEAAAGPGRAGLG